MKNLFILAIILLPSCSLNFEESIIEGKNNKVIEGAKQSDDANIKANAKVSTI